MGRVARLYSVIVPAFGVTWTLDSLAMAIDPRLNGPGWGRAPIHDFSGYVLSALFLGASWTLSAQPGSNLPFWSLNYEAWYYVLFGAAAFLHGRQRILALIAAALLAGPKILLLFPVWLVGVAASRRWRLVPSQWATPLLFVSLAGFSALEGLGGQQLFRQPITQWTPPCYSPHDYIVYALVALFIAALSPKLRRQCRGSRSIA